MVKRVIESLLNQYQLLPRYGCDLDDENLTGSITENVRRAAIDASRYLGIVQRSWHPSRNKTPEWPEKEYNMWESHHTNSGLKFALVVDIKKWTEFLNDTPCYLVATSKKKFSYIGLYKQSDSEGRFKLDRLPGVPRIPFLFHSDLYCNRQDAGKILKAFESFGKTIVH